MLGVVASLVIALLGLVAYALSGSDALLLDGLYSGVMAGSSLIAARIGANVIRPPDPGWPFGYEGQETLYVLFRSLVLIGVLSAAVLTALREISAYTRGQLPPTVDLGPVGWYTAVTVLLCLALAWVQRRDWIAGDRHSELLRMESQAAALDAAITAVAGGALLAAPLLRSTPLAPLVPISDALLVLLLAAVVVAEPVKRFLQAVRQAAGAACDPELIARVRQELAELLHTTNAGRSISLLEVSLLKVGRTTFLVAYLDPSTPVDGRWMDALRYRIEEHCGGWLGPLRTELILTAHPPFAATDPAVESSSLP